jgi:phospholipid/cholesterol/gamma-HCH transport system substrate-binding protein
VRNNLLETLIGGIVIAVASSFLYFAYSSTDVGTVDGYELNATFDGVTGISVGSDVRISGIKIGTVRSQTLNPATYQAVVTMSINHAYALPDDSSAKVALDGLLGGSFISIEPGGSSDMLENGGTIEYTQGSIDLIGLIGKFIYGSTDSEGAQ